MKTLDEVIKNFEICRKARLNLISCEGCTYAIGDNDFCIDCNEIDVLEWLKGYQKHIELDKLRDKYGGTAQKLRNTSQITCPKCHSEFVILPEANNPLTWDELKQMELKPVWVEWTKTEESYWCFVGEWFDDDEMRIYHIGRDYADYIHKTVYTPDIVQAYRKERK